MNLDELISKYIDGELSQEEDFILRETLKGNSKLREYFDDYIELHHSLQEDKYSIKVPKALYQKTEEAVMMRIFANAPDIQASTTIKSRRFSYQLLSMVAMIPIFILISIFNISDSNIGSYFDYFSNNYNIENDRSAIEIDDKNTNLLVNSNRANTISKINPTKSNKAQLDINYSVDIANNVDISDALEQENLQITDSELDIAIIENYYYDDENFEIMSSNIDLSEKSSDNISIVSTNNTLSTINAFPNKLNTNIELNNMLESNNPLANIVIPSGKITAVQLTSSFSQDFARTGISTSGNSSIFSMSQSLGYNIDDDNAFGIEFGVMEMQYDYRKFIQVDPNQNSSLAFIVNTLVDAGSAPKMYLPINLEHSHQVIWGLAFYNTKLISYGNLSVIGRIGLGSTDDGPLGMGRLVAKYKLVDGVVLNAGLEGKMFMIKTPLLDNLSTTVTSFGLVYGVQFNI